MAGFNFTEELRRVFAQARDEAEALGHGYVGTEHMLLGVLAVDDAVANLVLAQFGIDRKPAADRIIETLRRSTRRQEVTGPDLPYNAPAKKALERAMSEAQALITTTLARSTCCWHSCRRNAASRRSHCATWASRSTQRGCRSLR
jgi:ATP-dependent Clp protease ATP-binding subunit ClpA